MTSRYNNDGEPDHVRAADRNAHTRLTSRGPATAETFEQDFDDDRPTADILAFDPATIIGAAIRLCHLGVLSPGEHWRLIRYVAGYADEGDPTARLVLDYLRVDSDADLASSDTAGSSVKEEQ
ncbi:hypothetical protein [Jiella avicenniae]|uniref:Uncharacterized protein n=1 Tax=Jiella avicenniae TaxID=2907202 RepID=A0A9X1NYZ3_9HYPH|nr:hypothetical protein [Jiella avicenniae]MCE7028097.1 hypothetical protein [Jiella avicenniae]